MTAFTMPYTTSFETADFGKFYATDANANNETWGNYNNGTSASLGHTGTNAYGFDCYGFASGESEVLTMPEVTTANPSSIDFWVAYAQYDATTSDQLEVVYSTNCGSSWTSLWSAAGTTLSTAPATTSVFVPTASSYVKKSVDLSTIPTSNAIVGFRATSNYGNYIWIDDINIRAGLPSTSIKEVTQTLKANIFPNPTSTGAVVNFELENNSKVTVEVSDMVGRVVNTIAAGELTSGAQHISIATESLAPGLYNVKVITESGSVTERLTVIK